MRIKWLLRESLEQSLRTWYMVLSSLTLLFDYVSATQSAVDWAFIPVNK